VLEPQSDFFIALMIAAFAGLVWWLAVTRRLVFRIIAAILAFLPAMIVGVAAVNKYYDYYRTWGALASDLTGQVAGARTLPGFADTSRTAFSTFLGHVVNLSLARQEGLTLQLRLPGRLSHITRDGLIYLPPQYFRPAYKDYRFPVIELLHGTPGSPLDWIAAFTVNTVLTSLIDAGQAQPAVLVMPNANGARGVSLQCLNQVHGPQDATYLAIDVPADITRVLRVQPPGRAWGIAGYSEGGFCAANLGLQYGNRFGFAGVLSGYFAPLPNQLTHPARLVNPFGRNRRLRHLNSPDWLVVHKPLDQPIPQFWLGAGLGDPADVVAAEEFAQRLQFRQPNVVVRFVPRGGHTGAVWRALLPPMLEWMTPGLAAEAARAAAPRTGAGSPRPDPGQPSLSPGPSAR
jgi:enterochelin esterase-like enzyme